MKATVLTGKLKGQTVTIRQYCNDWATIDELQGMAVGLHSLLLDDEAKDRVLHDLHADLAENTNKRLGMMFNIFYDLTTFEDTGRFKKAKV